METINKRKEKGLPVLNNNADCNFEGYDATLLMSETAKLRSLITITMKHKKKEDNDDNNNESGMIDQLIWGKGKVPKGFKYSELEDNNRH